MPDTLDNSLLPFSKVFLELPVSRGKMPVRGAVELTSDGKRQESRCWLGGARGERDGFYDAGLTGLVVELGRIS